MGRQIKGLLYFFVTDIRHSLMIFWTILLGILVVSIAFSYFLLRVDDSGFYFGFPFAVYFYSAFLGFLTVKESIPFALKVGATRRNIFISIGLLFVGMAFAKAVMASTLQTVTELFIEATGIHTFNFLHPASFIQDTWITRVMMDTAIMFFLSVIMFIIGLLFYKFGLAGAGSIIGIIVVVLLLGIAQGWLIDFIVEVFADIELIFFIQMLGVGLVFYLLSFLFIRRITTVKAK